MSSNGVQSVERAFRLLETFAAHPGPLGVSRVAELTDLPLPTIHRLVSTLVELGYLRQEPSRQYALGPRLLLLAESSSAMLHALAVRHLRDLVEELGETANLAMLDGDDVAYVAQAPGRHSMRMFTEVGRRVHPHCTAVGKVLLADLSAPEAQRLLERTGMPRFTEHTITSAVQMSAELAVVREQGFALDDGEQEVGVRCVAVAVPHPTVRLAISVSGPAPRMSEELIARAVPILSDTALGLARDLD